MLHDADWIQLHLGRLAATRAADMAMTSGRGKKNSDQGMTSRQDDLEHVEEILHQLVTIGN